jgi:hypothetical protein
LFLGKVRGIPPLRPFFRVITGYGKKEYIFYKVFLLKIWNRGVRGVRGGESSIKSKIIFFLKIIFFVLKGFDPLP